MASWIVGIILVLIVGGIIFKLVKNRKNGKGGCACGGDCAHCHGCCSTQPKSF